MKVSQYQTIRKEFKVNMHSFLCQCTMINNKNNYLNIHFKSAVRIRANGLIWGGGGGLILSSLSRQSLIVLIQQ